MKRIVLTAIVVILVIGIVIYFGKDKTLINTISSNHPTSTGSSGSIDTQTGITQTGTDWNPEVMRTGPAIQDKSGVTVTITTNGPAVRTMTPEEAKEFQKKMQGK